MGDLTNLQWLALIGGSLLVLRFLASRRSYRNRQRGLSVTLIVGLATITISLFPDLLSIPRELLFSDPRPGAKLDTVLVIVATFLLFVALRNRSHVNRLIARQNGLLKSLATKDAIEKTFEADTAPKRDDSIAILIPAFNEAENLLELLPDIPDTLDGRRIYRIVVDDGSSDETASVAKANGALVVRMPMNSGGGLALSSGFEYVKNQGFDIVVTMDGDGQHNPREIGGLLQPILDGEADLVIGSRKIGEAEHISTLRTVGLDFFNFLISRFMGVNISDCASGFRAVRVGLLTQLKLAQEQYHTAELIIESAKQGASISEVPITIKKRTYGVSKKGHDFLYGIMFMRTVIKSWLR